MTPRQKEIMYLIAEGDTSKEIATKLHISIETVRTHRKELMKEYKAKNAVNLVALWKDDQCDEQMWINS